MKKILIAEDDKFLALAYKSKLMKSGYEVEVAHNGTEALEKLQKFTPSLILLDLIMPKQDGFAVLEGMDKKTLKEVPVIVTSNLSQKQDIDRALKLGAKDFIVKSDISLKNLIKRIEELLK